MSTGKITLEIVPNIVICVHVEEFVSDVQSAIGIKNAVGMRILPKNQNLCLDTSG